MVANYLTDRYFVIFDTVHSTKLGTVSALRLIAGLIPEE